MCEAMRTMPKATIAVIEGRVGGGQTVEGESRLGELAREL